MTTSPTDQSSTTVKAKLKKKERREVGRCNVDDSCTTDDQRKIPNHQLLQFRMSSYVLRNLHLGTSCENNALVLVDQVGL